MYFKRLNIILNNQTKVWWTSTVNIIRDIDDRSQVKRLSFAQVDVESNRPGRIDPTHTNIEIGTSMFSIVAPVLAYI